MSGEYSDPTVLRHRGWRTEYEFTKHPDATTFGPVCPECCGPIAVMFRPTPDGGRDVLVCSACLLEV